jgi:hypothetical protein
MCASKGISIQEGKNRKNEDKLNDVELDVLSGGVESFPSARKSFKWEYFLYVVH